MITREELVQMIKGEEKRYNEVVGKNGFCPASFKLMKKIERLESMLEVYPT